MATSNNITGDKLISKPANDKYLEGWERIFGPHIIETDNMDDEKIPYFLKRQAS